METKTKAFGLTGNQLKILAIFLMTVDHVGAYLLPQYSVLRIIGRLAMPIFAYMIAEGCRYTKNRPRYLLTIAGFALVCQIVYLVFQNSLSQCILVTFSMSILLIYAVDFASKRRSVLSLCVMGAAFGIICYVCVFLPGKLPGTDFRVDYGFFGVLLPVMIYMGRTKQEKLLLCACALTAIAMTGYQFQWYALLSLPLLALYNGQRGKRPLKYLFYFYYPLHLVAIYAIGLLLNHLI